MNLFNITIQTQRLTLRSISDACLQDIYDASLAPGLTQYMTWDPPKSISDTQAFIVVTLEKMRLGEELTCTVHSTTTDEFLGICTLRKINSNIPEIGLWIKVSAHGNKYGQEAARGMKDWADENLQYEHLTYPVVAINIASRKVAESLGGVLAGEKKVKRLNGEEMDGVVYTILP